MSVGVLALQGDFREHLAMVRGRGAEATEVRTPAELEAVDALVIPGGESTTIGRLANLYGLVEPIRSRIHGGMPALGTCAGMIFLSKATVGHDQPLLGVLDAVVRRNAFGRQVDSFEADLDVKGFDASMHAVFIRAPWIEEVGSAVDVLAETDGPNGVRHPVLVRQGHILATSFHPELTDDARLHELLISFIPS